MASLAIGLVYDLLGTHPRSPGDPPDVDAEYEPESTLLLLESAVRRAGHRPVRIGNPHALLTRLGKGERPAVDAVWNVAEGFGGRNREGWAPVLLEMAGIPFLGSDALSLSLSLDKLWALRHAEAAGIPVARRALMSSPEEAENAALPAAFPLFVKPRHEGTAKGIAPTSRVADRAGLAGEVARVVRDYRQPALVEEFLPGAEYTVTVIGHDPPRALPVLQRALEDTTGIGLHAIERHAGEGAAWSHSTPGILDADLESELERLALRAFETFECADFARVDFRLDAEGRPRFLEINPLPTFAEDSAFATTAELRGVPPEDLLAEVLNEALTRLA